MKPGSITILIAIPVAIILTCFSAKRARGNIYHSNAEIIMADNSNRPCNGNDPCNCPGGFLIQIDSVPQPHGRCILCNSFKAMRFPDGFDVGKIQKFPIAVTIDWTLDSLSCDSSRIDIVSIVRR